MFVQAADGGWRVIGTVLGGTTGTPCNSAADFQRLDVVVPAFEAQTGLDITPCFDGQTGAWDPGPDCGGFFAGDHTGSGTWSDWCEGTPASGPSDECGQPFGGGGGSPGTAGASTGAQESSTGGDAGTGSSGAYETSGVGTTGEDEVEGSTGPAALPGADSADQGGCACRTLPVGSKWSLGLIALAIGARIRRTYC